MKKSREEILADIQYWYDGFCFAPNAPKVYNPFSLLMLFDKGSFEVYWFETGTPTFLIKLIRQKGYDLEQMEELYVRQAAFGSYEPERLDVTALLVQTGYLT